jgi:hypothetical protein
MKSKKLNLSELKVKSFVTDIEKETSHTAKGGATAACSDIICNTTDNSVIICISDACATLANCITEDQIK